MGKPAINALLALEHLGIIPECAMTPAQMDTSIRIMSALVAAQDAKNALTRQLDTALNASILTAGT